MTSIRSTFKTLGRAAIVAVAFGVTATAATSAFAQSGPSVNFSIQLPGGGGNNNQAQSPSLLGKGSANDRNWNGNGGYGYRCLTNREVRQGIADYGYRQVEVTRELRRDRVEVQAVYGNWVYSMRVDKCTGYVDQAQRIGRANGGGGWNGGNGGWNNGGGYNGGGYNGGGYDDGGFGFQFNFGN